MNLAEVAIFVTIKCRNDELSCFFTNRLSAISFNSLFAIVSKYILQTYLRTALLKETIWQPEKAKLLKVMESNPCEEFKTS